MNVDKPSVTLKKGRLLKSILRLRTWWTIIRGKSFKSPNSIDYSATVWLFDAFRRVLIWNFWDTKVGCRTSKCLPWASQERPVGLAGSKMLKVQENSKREFEKCCSQKVTNMGINRAYTEVHPTNTQQIVTYSILCFLWRKWQRSAEPPAWCHDKAKSRSLLETCQISRMFLNRATRNAKKYEDITLGTVTDRLAETTAQSHQWGSAFAERSCSETSYRSLLSIISDSHMRVSG